ncbi:MAG: DivIVA domain-containing protein [Nocardioidaceae bacterium]|nr:MAG: DivIVA domain-containing protein [Nocardioidaceae bacterium]
MWFFALVVVAVLGAIAVVATGRWGELGQVYDDRRDAVAPGQRELNATDLRRVRFTTSLLGYRASEVDALLDRLAAELEAARPAQTDEASLPGADSN